MLGSLGHHYHHIPSKISKMVGKCAMPWGVAEAGVLALCSNLQLTFEEMGISI